MNLNNGVLDGIRRIGGRFRDVTVDGGLPGAPLGLRIRGATASGAPATGTWKARDVIEDGTGTLWLCTAGGSPGTWQALTVQGNEAGGGLSIASLGLGIATAPFSQITITSNSLVNEQLFATLCTASVTKTITKLGLILSIAGATPGSGVNLMAIFSASGGTQLGITADMTSAMESTGQVEGALTSGVAITAGTNYYLVVLSSFTGTTPKAASISVTAGEGSSRACTRTCTRAA